MLLRSTDHIPSQEKARAELEWLSYLKSHALDLHFIEIIYDIVMSSVLQLLFHSFCPPFHIAMLQECSIHGPWKPFFFHLWILFGSVRRGSQAAAEWRQTSEVTVILTSLLPKFISCFLFLPKLPSPYDF